MSGTELFDLYDSENCSLNIVKERKKVHQDGDWHRTSQIWIMNEKKEILCNLRSQSKDVFPNYWDLSIGGHVVAGDTYEQTALRELQEELGIEIRLEELTFLGDEKVDSKDVTTNSVDREHARLFLYKTNKNIQEFSFSREEIDKIDFFPINKLIYILEEKRVEEMNIVPSKHFLIKTLRRLDSI